MNKRYVWLAAAIVWCVAIFIATASPSSTGGSTQELLSKIFQLTEEQAALINVLFRKGVHLTAFGLLAFLFYMSFEKRRYLLAWVLTTLYAASDEYHQTFLPNRDGLLSDVALDSLGALLALVMIKIITVIGERRRKSRWMLKRK